MDKTLIINRKQGIFDFGITIIGAHESTTDINVFAPIILRTHCKTDLFVYRHIRRKIFGIDR